MDKENKAYVPVLGLKRKGAFNPPAFKKPAGLPQPTAKGAPLSQQGTAGAASSSTQHPGAHDARYFQALYTKYQPGKKVRQEHPALGRCKPEVALITMLRAPAAAQEQVFC